MDDHSQIWVNDSDATQCNVCQTVFGYITNRPHHCRLCGSAICVACMTALIPKRYVIGEDVYIESDLPPLTDLKLLKHKPSDQLPSFFASMRSPPRHNKICTNCTQIHQGEKDSWDVASSFSYILSTITDRECVSDIAYQCLYSYNIYMENNQTMHVPTIPITPGAVIGRWIHRILTFDITRDSVTSITKYMHMRKMCDTVFNVVLLEIEHNMQRSTRSRSSPIYLRTQKKMYHMLLVCMMCGTCNHTIPSAVADDMVQNQDVLQHMLLHSQLKYPVKLTQGLYTRIIRALTCVKSTLWTSRLLLPGVQLENTNEQLNEVVSHMTCALHHGGIPASLKPRSDLYRKIATQLFNSFMYKKGTDTQCMTTSAEMDKMYFQQYKGKTPAVSYAFKSILDNGVSHSQKVLMHNDQVVVYSDGRSILIPMHKCHEFGYIVQCIARSFKRYQTQFSCCTWAKESVDDACILSSALDFVQTDNKENTLCHIPMKKLPSNVDVMLLNEDVASFGEISIFVATLGILLYSFLYEWKYAHQSIPIVLRRKQNQQNRVVLPLTPHACLTIYNMLNSQKTPVDMFTNIIDKLCDFLEVEKHTLMFTLFQVTQSMEQARDIYSKIVSSVYKATSFTNLYESIV